MNILLNDRERNAYKDSIQELHILCPETISRKIPRANIQQAFILYEVKKLCNKESELLCVGSYEDTACESLIKLGYNIVCIDPFINVSLEDFFRTTDKKFDLIFSTSVIEHVQNDELFIDQICKLLNPNGYAVLTCDFNNEYGKIGVGKPAEDHRLYTKDDLLVRFDKILRSNDCEMHGKSDYDHEPDFEYGGCKYSFATYTFWKQA